MTKIRSEYEIGLKDDTSQTLSRITSGLNKFKTAIAAVGTIGGVGAFAAVTARISSAVNLADELNKASQKAGVTVEALSALDYAARLSDVSTEGLVGGIEKLSRTMSQASQAAGAQRTAFEATGIAFKNTDGTLRDTTAVFGDIAKYFATLPDGATKTALAMQFFGKTGAELIPLLNSNADGFKAITAEAKQFGVVMSKDLAQQSEDLKDNFTRLEAASSALGITLATDIVPALANMTAEFVKNYRESSGLLRTFDALGATIANLGRGTDQERLGGLLLEEIELEKKIKDLQKAFDEGDTGKLVFIARMKMLKSDLASVRQEAEGLRAVMQPSEFGAAGSTDKGFVGPPISDAQRKANEARVRAALDSAAAEAAASKKRQAEQDRLAKAQDDYLAKQRESLSLEGQTSEEAKVLADIKFGAAKDFTEKAQKEAIENAKNLDILQGTADVHEVLNGYVRERAELEGKATQQLVDSRQSVIDSLMTPLEKYTEKVKELITLELTPDQLARGIAMARVEMTDAQSKASGLKDTVRELGLTFSSAFEDAVLGASKFSDVLKGLGEDITRLLLRKTVTEPLFNFLGNFANSSIAGGGGSLFGGGSSGGGGGFSNFSALSFGGGLASGGGVSRGKYYMVGEHGPEWFAPGQSGSIIPNGGGAVTVNVHNYGPQQDINARTDGRTVDVFIGGSLAKSMASGRARPLGLTPALATR